jgi:hypothetical protein
MFMRFFPCSTTDDLYCFFNAAKRDLFHNQPRFISFWKHYTPMTRSTQGSSKGARRLVQEKALIAHSLDLDFQNISQRNTRAIIKKNQYDL